MIHGEIKMFIRNIVHAFFIEKIFQNQSLLKKFDWHNNNECLSSSS